MLEVKQGSAKKPERKLSISRRLDTKDIENLTGKHRCTIWRWVKAGKFPAPQYINGQRSWTEDVIVEWDSSLESFEEHHAA